MTTGNTKKDRYAEAGVDIDAGDRFIKLIKPVVSKTFKPGVITDIGGFAGLFSLHLQDIQNPVLVASTDGVGTKLKVAFMMDKHDTVGIDLVAMCVNDILVQGADPLFMLDYISMGKLDVPKAVSLVKGIAAGCKEADCSLIGGETAEMPGFYDQDGLHSNGYSLVRKVFFEELKMSVEDHVEEFSRTLGEELLVPTRIYTRAIKNLRRNFRIYGIAHITGGGLIENLPRILPKQCKVVIDTSTWTRPAVFQVIQNQGKIPSREMMRTFNNGLGLVIVVSEEETDEIILRLNAMGETAFHIGSVESRHDKEDPIQLTD